MGSPALSRPLGVIDLFAGIGGFSLGFDMFEEYTAGKYYRLVGFADKDPDACETLRYYLLRQGIDANMVIEGDLTESETKDRIVAEFRGKVDIILGGPPCQSFSTIGPRSGYGKYDKRWERDPRDKLYEHYIALVRELQPTFILFENVLGLLSKKNPDGRRFIDIITDDLKDLGYKLGFNAEEVGDEYLVLNAADYGVPQVRRRVFIIGNKLGIPNSFPEPTHSEEPRNLGLLPWVTLRDAIGDLPELEAPMTLTDIPPVEHDQIRRKNRSRNTGVDRRPYHWDLFERHYESLPRQGKAFLDWVRPRDRESAELIGHIARGQQKSDIELFRRMPEGCSSAQLQREPGYDDILELIKYDMSSFKDKYKKQAMDKPCTTVFAHMQKDGNRFIHPSQARTLTVREAARVQSFPDDYEICATGLRRFAYIGNAVPPLVSMALAQSVIATYNRFLEQAEILSVPEVAGTDD